MSSVGKRVIGRCIRGEGRDWFGSEDEEKEKGNVVGNGEVNVV